MARNYFITDKVKLLVSNAFHDHPDWKAARITEHVRKSLGQVESKNFKWPGVSSIQKLLRGYRENPPNDLDQNWSTAALEKHPIPPELLPIVLKAWVNAREKLHTSFTIRQALWVMRLSSIYRDVDDKYEDILTFMAWVYSQQDLHASLAKVPLDTSTADLGLYGTIIGESLTEERKDYILHKYIDEVNSLDSSKKQMLKIVESIKQIKKEEKQHGRG